MSESKPSRKERTKIPRQHMPEQPAAARHISWPAEDFGQARRR